MGGRECGVGVLRSRARQNPVVFISRHPGRSTRGAAQRGADPAMDLLIGRDEVLRAAAKACFGVRPPTRHGLPGGHYDWSGWAQRAISRSPRGRCPRRRPPHGHHFDHLLTCESWAFMRWKRSFVASQLFQILVIRGGCPVAQFGGSRAQFGDIQFSHVSSSADVHWHIDQPIAGWDVAEVHGAYHRVPGLLLRPDGLRVACIRGAPDPGTLFVGQVSPD